MEEIDNNIASILYIIPNIPHESVPIGPDPEGNKVVRAEGGSVWLAGP